MFSTNTSFAGHSSRQITEVFLFINPIGSKCYKAEKEILDFADRHEGKVHLQFVPLYNFQTVAAYMKANQLPENDLTLRNKLCSHMLEACQAYAAATMQGKKNGRRFLMAVQHALIEEQQDFSSELLTEKAVESGLDISMFLEDKNSELSLSTYESDQKLARDMRVISSPSCVLFRHQDHDHGILIEDCVTAELLEKLCLSSESVSPFQNAHSQTLNLFAEPKLRVL